jgi:hypothetical protein
MVIMSVLIPTKHSCPARTLAIATRDCRALGIQLCKRGDSGTQIYIEAWDMYRVRGSKSKSMEVRKITH